MCLLLKFSFLKSAKVIILLLWCGCEHTKSEFVYKCTAHICMFISDTALYTGQQQTTTAVLKHELIYHSNLSRLLTVVNTPLR